jgi:hypothetical protein
MLKRVPVIGKVSGLVGPALTGAAHLIADEPDGHATGGPIKGYAGKLGSWVKAIGPAAHEIPQTPPGKLSDWAQNYIGHYLVPTQADRMGGVGGPSYSANQLSLPQYANRAWGSGKLGTASGIANLAKDPNFGGAQNQIFVPVLGSPKMHQSNPLVFEQLYKQFYKDPSKLTDELADKINNHIRTGGMTPSGKMSFDPIPDFDIRDKSMVKKLGENFNTRRDIANYAFGAEGMGKRKSQIIPYEQMLQEMSDPTVAGAKSFSVGPRAFKLTGDVESTPRPDLNAAYPYQLHGEDLGVTYNPVPTELALMDFGKQWRKDTDKETPLKSGASRNPSYYEHTVGYFPPGSSTRIIPRQEITEPWIKELQSSGFKKGGLASLRRAA